MICKIRELDHPLSTIVAHIKTVDQEHQSVAAKSVVDLENKRET
ncbi:MAG: hypothetical protein WA117_06405 [Verrucomicrobiia bacterium]